MLRPADVLEKTDKGHEELRTRQHKLAAKMRALLLMVDGNQSVGALQEQMAHLGFAEDALQALEGQGFVKARDAAPVPAVATAVPAAAPATTPAVVAAAVPDEPVAETTPFTAARRLMNESVHKTLGLKGFFFTLKIEKSSNTAELRDLLPEYEALMKKALSEDTAELFIARARELLA